MVNLPGTIVLNYDISGPATALSSTAIAAYLTDSGNNGTDTATGTIDLVTTGNSQAGVVDLADADSWIKSRDVSAIVAFGGTTAGAQSAANTGASFVSLAFKITHAAGDMLSGEAA